MTNEEIKWENASELNHMKNQITLSETERAEVSKFLCIANEDNYNTKLDSLKKFLEDIPNSKLFSDSLKPLQYHNPIVWNRYDPIDQTPLTHMLYGSYVRVQVLPDEFQGRPIPNIFFRGKSILSLAEPTIEGYEKIYCMVKPFNYDFQDFIEADSMQFRLLDISNPNYVNLSHRDSIYRGYPTPIYKEGKIIPMMSDKEYTKAYKNYRLQKSNLGKTL
jgi:hypothetical protein